MGGVVGDGVWGIFFGVGDREANEEKELVVRR